MPFAALQRQIGAGGIVLRTGPVATRVRSRVPEVARGIAIHYANHEFETSGAFADFDVAVDWPSGPRRWLRRQVLFRFDGEEPFAPLPGAQGFPLLEWGMNWCIYTHCHQYLTLHSAVVERGGRALLMPAPSGSGKSTLCAALAFGGWRLLSDELTVIDTRSGLVVPVPRPISLKNRSIDVIRERVPDAVFSPAVPDTLKGTVAHARPPAEAVRRAAERATPAWVVLPRYRPDAPAQLVPASRAQVFMRLVENTFNYSVHGESAFHLLAALIDRCDCFEFTYGNLDEAMQVFDELAARPT